jgi:hypothetical protein
MGIGDRHMAFREHEANESYMNFASGSPLRPESIHVDCEGHQISSKSPHPNLPDLTT